MANFGWDKSKARVKEAATNALRDVGYVLLSRRLHLGRTQQQIAREASRIYGTSGAITQPHIDALEDGKLQGPLRGAGYTGVDAVLAALNWRKEDLEFMRHMIKEFARIE
jgi:hypothetical protein